MLGTWTLWVRAGSKAPTHACDPRLLGARTFRSVLFQVCRSLVVSILRQNGLTRQIRWRNEIGSGDLIRQLQAYLDPKNM